MGNEAYKAKGRVMKSRVLAEMKTALLAALIVFAVLLCPPEDDPLAEVPSPMYERQILTG